MIAILAELFNIAFEIIGKNYFLNCLLLSAFFVVISVTVLKSLLYFYYKNKISAQKRQPDIRLSRKQRRRYRRRFTPTAEKIGRMIFWSVLLFGILLFLYNYFDYYRIRFEYGDKIKVIVFNFGGPKLEDYFGDGLNDILRNIISADIPIEYSDKIKVINSNRYVESLSDARTYGEKYRANILLWGFAIGGIKKGTIQFNITEGITTTFLIGGSKINFWSYLRKEQEIDFDDPYANIRAVKLNVRPLLMAQLASLYLEQGNRQTAVDIMKNIYYDKPAGDIGDWCLKFILGYWLYDGGKYMEAIHVWGQLEKEQKEIDNEAINDKKHLVLVGLKDCYKSLDSLRIADHYIKRIINEYPSYALSFFDTTEYRTVKMLEMDSSGAVLFEAEK